MNNPLKFTIISWLNQDRPSNTHDLISQIHKQGHMARVASMRDLYFLTNAGHFYITFNDKTPVEEVTDILIIRSYGAYRDEASLLVRYCLDHQVTVIDEEAGKPWGKMLQAYHLLRHNLPVIPSIQALRKLSYHAILAHAPFPLIVKPTEGKQGRNILKLATFSEATRFFSPYMRGFFLQHYIPITYDIRVLVVGNSVLGAMKREIISGDVRSNASLGATTHPIPLTETLRTLALRATKAMGYEIAGVDVIEYEHSYLILEVNICPQWQAFKKTTGINPAEAIVEYAINKYLAIR